MKLHELTKQYEELKNEAEMLELWIMYADSIELNAFVDALVDELEDTLDKIESLITFETKEYDGRYVTTTESQIHIPALTDEAITELADKINFIKRLKSELNILEARKEDLEETLAETEEALKTMKDDLGFE